MKALVIDDSVAMRLILRRILQHLGYGVYEAPEGESAWEMMPEIWSELVIILVDWNMPRMDGFEFVEKVRADALYDDIPIMMVTSESDLSRMKIVMDTGADEYIIKPFTSDAIQAKLELLGVQP